MKLSHTAAGCVLLGGLALTAVGGMMAAHAGGHVGNLHDDLYYDVLGWIGTLIAVAGIVAFFWGAKVFAQQPGKPETR